MINPAVAGWRSSRPPAVPPSVTTAAHRVRFHSGGQAPILHYKAATGAYIHHMPTSFPLAAMAMNILFQSRRSRQAKGTT